MYKVLDLFSGIGGFSLGLEKTGAFQTAAFCELDEACHRVLEHHWPGVPIFGDIKELTGERLQARGIVPQVLAGGFPCTDISLAKANAQGIDGEESGLWVEYARLIRECRPSWVIIENVPPLLIRGATQVLKDLLAAGYDAEWACIRASDLGAPHIRDRIWIVAYPISEGPSVREGELRVTREEQPAVERAGDSSSPRLVRLHHYLEQARRQDYWGDGVIEGGRLTKPGLRLLAPGVPHRVQRLRQLGNAVVPYIPMCIGQAIIDYERRHHGH